MDSLIHTCVAIMTALSLVGSAAYANLAAVITPLLPDTRPHVLFVGDLMFDRTIRAAMVENGNDYPFSCIDSTLKGADMVVGNLEGPITDSPSRSLGSKVGAPDNFVFTFATSVAPTLARHNIKVVALGNNHILNFGFSGLARTKDALDQASVGYFGDPGAQSVYESDLKGVPLTFINYNQFYSGSTASTTKAEIRAARASGRIPIVFAHWGNEYQPASSAQKELAHSFVDTGAALVIGAHPHVIEESEVYHNAYIFYSLGNFIFDQYWNDAVRDGLIVDVTFDQNGVADVTASHVELEKDRRTCLMNP